MMVETDNSTYRVSNDQFVIPVNTTLHFHLKVKPAFDYQVFEVREPNLESFVEAMLKISYIKHTLLQIGFKYEYYVGNGNWEEQNFSYNTKGEFLGDNKEWLDVSDSDENSYDIFVYSACVPV